MVSNTNKNYSKILWLNPNLNHYKSRYLSYLHKNYKIDITSISGIGRLGKGDHKLDIDFPFKNIKLHVTKKEFGFSSKVRKSVKNNIFDFNWILVPAEKKNFLLILYVYFLKVKIKFLYKKKIRMVSYDHHLKNSNRHKLIENEAASQPGGRAAGWGLDLF